MSIGAILGAIGALGAIVGALKYWTQLTVWLFKKAPASKAQDIQKEVKDDINEIKDGGRPKWD